MLLPYTLLPLTPLLLALQPATLLLATLLLIAPLPLNTLQPKTRPLSAAVSPPPRRGPLPLYMLGSRPIPTAMYARGGVRSIEDTRYQARLDAKVEELAQVYCSKEFVLGINHTLSQDDKFIKQLTTHWQLEFTERVVYLYRMLFMYRQPLIHTDSGYHVLRRSSPI